MRIIFDELLLKPDLEKGEEIFFDKQTGLQKVIYPEMSSEAEWDVDTIRKLNKVLFKKVSRKNIVYALYVKEKGKNKWHIRYVGHSAAAYSRSRLNNHLVKRSDRTGSQLENVKENVYQGNSIAIIFIEINPPELRHYFEEKIICRHGTELVWNTNGK